MNIADGRIKELDGVRAMAVIMVMFCHWTLTTSYVGLNRLSMLGAIGVDIFFVLSGYLITGILLDGKHHLEENKIGLKKIIGNFYARRALRIFPVFYLLLLILFIMSFSNTNITRKELLFGATYTINFYFHKYRVSTTHTGHFWSLAVEEQFYVIWPFIILFVRRKWLPLVIACFIVTGTVTQFFADYQFDYVITYTCFDGFGLGALLAYIVFYRQSLIPVFYKAVCVIAALCFIVFMYQFLSKNILVGWPLRTINCMLALFVITTIIKSRLNGSYSIISRVLGNKVLVFIGRISYGVYLYHVYMPYITGYLSRYLPAIDFFTDHPFIRFLLWFGINFLLVIFIAWLSWQLIEKPILRLRKRFSL